MSLSRIPVAAVVVFGLLSAYPTAAPEFSEWSAPVNLGPIVNSAAADGSPALSKDGRSLYFASRRPGELGGNDLYVSQWDDAAEAWGVPQNLNALGAIVNTTATEFSPNLSRDGHWLFFHSNRSGTVPPGSDIWVSYRSNVHDDFAWETPTRVESGVNAPGLDTSPSFFENDEVGIPQLFFSSNRNVMGANDIYVSEQLADGTFGPASRVAELSSPQVEPGASIRFDGLEAVLFRPGIFGGFDLWTATRQTVFDAWSEPTNLGPVVNSAFNEADPHLGPDRQALYFASNRSGQADLYVSFRTKVQGRGGQPNAND